MANLSTEILCDAKQTIIRQRIIIILLIIMLICVTSYKFPKNEQTEPNTTHYYSEAQSMNIIPPIKPAEYGRAKLKRFRFSASI